MGLVPKKSGWSWKEGSVRIPRGRFDSLHTDFLIEMDEAALEARPDDVDALRRLGELYTRRGRAPDGLAIDRRLAQLCPNDATVHYNLACSLALTGDAGASFEALRRAVDLGYHDPGHMEADPDLEALRRDERWKDLLARASRRVV